MKSNNRWTKNARLRFAAAIAALLATIGLYGLIQANPLPGGNAAAPTPVTTSAAPMVPAAGAGAPELGVSTSAGGGSDAGLSPFTAPAPRIHTRTRAS